MILILAALICTSDGSLNDKVVEFARSKLGRQVGNGQCNTLAVEALRHSGGSRRGARDSVWGDELTSLEGAKAGDILQFEDVEFFSREVRDDGAVFTQSRRLPHHTAIIAKVKKQGPKPVLVILHQNVDNKPIVQEWTIDMADKKSGTVKGYRPVAD
jgi:hypothetical protein